jgi:hypothetical protein
MKILSIIVITFVIAFATTLLYDLEFVKNNIARIILTTLLILLEMATGFFYVKVQIKNLKNESN